MLYWRTITPSHDAKFLSKGTELSFAIVPNTAHRFTISEVRVFSRCGDMHEYDREYHVRDAHAISDADIHAGKRPPIVARFPDEDSALAWCTQQFAADDWEPFWDNPDGPGAA